MPRKTKAAKRVIAKSTVEPDARLTIPVPKLRPSGVVPTLEGDRPTIPVPRAGRKRLAADFNSDTIPAPSITEFDADEPDTSS